MDRLIVNYVKNPGDPLLDREIREFPVGTTLQECLEAINPEAASYEHVVNIDGMILSHMADLTVMRPTGIVVVCPVPQGNGGGGKILRAIAAIAIIVVSAYTGQVYGAQAAAGLLGAGATAAQVAATSAMITVAMSTAGSMLVNALTPPASGDLTGGLPSLERSATYGWEATGNPTREGIPWPVLYGTHRITPPIISQYIEVVDDRQYLNILYALADHELSAIDPTTIEINGNSIATYYDGITWEFRYGYPDQAVLQRFSDTRSTKTAGVKVSENWTTIETDSDSAEGVAVALSLPRGLYEVNRDGDLIDHTVNLDIEYKRVGDSSWTRLQSVNTSPYTFTLNRWSGGYYMRSDEQINFGQWVWVESLAGSSNPDDHYEGEPYTSTDWYWDEYGDKNYRIYQWHWVTGVSETTYAVGTVTLDFVIITAKQSSPIRRIFTKDRIAAGTYQIRVRFHNGDAPPNETKYANDVYLDYIDEVVYDDFTYPGTALLALRALATDKLSGGMPTVTIVASRSTVDVWDGSHTVQKPADNPAWVAYDILHNSVYGGGISPLRLPYADFAAWATYCDAKGYHVNAYFDSVMNIRKVLDLISRLGEGAVAQIGAGCSCYVDQEVANPVQSFMFNAGNTIRDSYAEEYMAVEDRANCIEVTFWDASNGYRRTMIEMPAADFDEATQEIKKNTLELVGCTSRDEAIKHGYRALNRNRYLTKTASWDAGIDSLGCMPWDPVVPPTGMDGRVVSGTADSVTIDREVTLLPGHTYLIRVKKATDDTVEEKTVAEVGEATTTDTLTVTENWTHIPVEHELFIFYEEGQDRGLMRVLKISRKSDHTRRITAIEYHPSACDDAGTIEPAEVPAVPVYVSHLRASEIWKGGATGGCMLSWSGSAGRWNVYHRKQGAADWIADGPTYYPYYEVMNLTFGESYEFLVSPADISSGETAFLTITGNAAWGRIAPNGSGWMGGDGIFAWDDTGKVSVSGFEATSSSLSFTASGRTTKISSGGNYAFFAGKTGDPAFSVSHAGQIWAADCFIGKLTNFLAYDPVDGLRVVGDTLFSGGKFLISNTGGILAHDSGGQGVIRIGTDSSDDETSTGTNQKGIFIYGPEILSTVESKGAVEGNEINLTHGGQRLRIKASDNYLMAKFTSDEIVVGKLSSGHSLHYTIADGLAIEGKITATTGKIGGWNLGLYHLWDLESGDPNNQPGKGIIFGVNGGTGLYKTRISVRGGVDVGEVSGEVIRIGNIRQFLDYPVDFSEPWGIGVGTADSNMTWDAIHGLRVKGKITALTGTIADWIISPGILKSADSGSRIELNQPLSRISVIDSSDSAKVAMGYLSGLAKNDGSGNWGTSDYGFWAASGDSLVIDGNVDYQSGDWIVKNDGSLLILDSSDKVILRLGTGGTPPHKGLFIYNTSGNVLAKFLDSEIYVGTTGNCISYTTNAGLVLHGTVNVTGGNAATQSYADSAAGSAQSSAQSYASGLFSGITVPSGTGLFIGTDGMGYYTNNAFQTYIKNDGSFYFGDVASGGKGLRWLQSTGALTLTCETLGVRYSGNEGSGTCTVFNTNSTSGYEGGGFVCGSDPGGALASSKRLGFTAYSGAYDSAHGCQNAAAVSAWSTEDFDSTHTGAELRLEGTLKGVTTYHDGRDRYTALKTGTDWQGVFLPSGCSFLLGTYSDSLGTYNFWQSGGDFRLCGVGTADTDAARVFSNEKHLYLQMGTGNEIYFRGPTAGILFTMTSGANLLVGATAGIGGSGTDIISILNGTDPGAHYDDCVQIYSKDSSAGSANATLALFLEQAVEDVGTFTPTKKIRVWINGVEYWLQLDPVS